MLEQLQEQWNQVLNKHSELPGISQDTFNDLVHRYSDPERAYHNLHHIVQLLQTAETFKARLHDYKAVFLAIWFHDAVYNPLANDNEIESAALADTHLSRLLLEEKSVEKVKKMILATAHHLQLEEGSSPDTLFLLDFDLMILGSSQEEYKTYSSQIRKEYQSIPDLLYKPGRKRILQRFLETKRLFKTEEFYILYEHQARTNIQWELSLLG